MDDRGSIYDASFFKRIEKGAYQSAQIILKTLFACYRPASMIDVGGGTGAWSRAAGELGVADITLIDGSYVDKAQLLVPPECFVESDLEQPLSLDRRADFLTCMEVAEHLSPRRAQSFIGDLCRLSDVILFSAALPFQGGDGHINEMWPEYWASLFAEHGYLAFDTIRPALWLNRQVNWWYRQNALLFCAPDAAAAHFGDRSPAQPDELTRIHPECYILMVHRSMPRRYRFSQGRDLKNFYNFGDASGFGRLGYGGEFDSLPQPGMIMPYFEALRGVIVGPGRVGSSMLANVLSTHKDLFCLNETQDLPLLQHRFGSRVVETAALAEAYLGVHFTSGQSVAGMNARRAKMRPAHLAAYLERLSQRFRRLDVRTFQAYLGAYFLWATGASALIDKTPDYAHHLDEILRLWPDVRILLMVRDAAQTALSMRRHEGYRVLASMGAVSWPEVLARGEPHLPADASNAPETLAPYLDIWCARVEAALSAGSTLDATQFAVLRLEELCQRPQAEARRLARFFGVEAHAAWLARMEKVAALPTPANAAALQEAQEAVAAHPRADNLRRELGYTKGSQGFSKNNTIGP